MSYYKLSQGDLILSKYDNVVYLILSCEGDRARYAFYKNGKYRLQSTSYKICYFLLEDWTRIPRRGRRDTSTKKF